MTLCKVSKVPLGVTISGVVHHRDGDMVASVNSAYWAAWSADFDDKYGIKWSTIIASKVCSCTIFRVAKIRIYVSKVVRSTILAAAASNSGDLEIAFLFASSHAQMLNTLVKHLLKIANFCEDS
jgi:hypothetical protein